MLGVALLVLSTGPTAALEFGKLNASPEDVGLSSARLARATELLRKHLDAGEIAGAVGAVARGGKVVYLETVGWQDVAAKTPMQSDTVFRIFSMTKPMTAVAAMRLVERAELQLSDPVSKYIPEFANAAVLVDSSNPDTSGTRPPSRPILVKDLLLHTDGLSHRWSKLYRMRGVHSRKLTLAEVAVNVAKAPMMEDPGTHWRYGIGPTVLARIVEVVSGKPYARYLEDEVLGPLGMSDTGYHVDTEQATRFASLYRTTDEGGIEWQPEDPSIPYTEPPALFDGASNMLSTAPDYLRLGQMLLGGGALDGTRVLSRKTIERMTVNHLPDELLPMQIQDSVFEGHGWGFGFGIIEDHRQPAMTVSNGEITWGGAAGTRFWVDPSEQMVTVLMVQILPHSAYALGDRFKTAVYHAIVD
ncbi:MAG: serine hydrolase domain-containing protein [Gammaproteobacteria bacterium]